MSGEEESGRGGDRCGTAPALAAVMRADVACSCIQLRSDPCVQTLRADRNIERDLGRKPTRRKHTKNEIKALVRQLKDIVGTLANAHPEDKRALYDELGVDLTYHQDGRVHVA